MILIIDNYDSFTFNLVHFIGELGIECKVIRNDTIASKEVLGMKLDALIMSPGPCTPNEAGICLDLVKEAPETLPILGVCLGHQAIGQAFGAKIIRTPLIMHGKRALIQNTQTGIFKGLPQAYLATLYHSLMVKKETLPDCLSITAKTQNEVIMGLEHKTRPVFGVQFHPESIASLHGHALLANFLEIAGLNPSMKTVKTKPLLELG